MKVLKFIAAFALLEGVCGGELKVLPAEKLVSCTKNKKPTYFDVSDITYEPINDTSFIVNGKKHSNCLRKFLFFTIF